MSQYAISDIHGCIQTFRYLVEQVIKLKPSDHLYLLGDYVDRGPDSKGVLDYIMGLQDRGYPVTTLMGNHEDMMLQALEGDEYQGQWNFNGGRQTMASFGAPILQAIPEKYWNFLHQLDFYVELEDYLLVHAGFDFTSAHPFQNHEAMLWIREVQVDPVYTKNKTIVHGHTPIPLSEIEITAANKNNKIIDIDGGCVFKFRLGHLTALNLDTRQVYSIANCED